MATKPTSVGEQERARLWRIVNDDPLPRPALEELHGEVWNSQEVVRDFALLGFYDPFVVVRRISDGLVGTLIFQEEPRFYFRFRPKISA